jgi:MFS family permease
MWPLPMVAMMGIAGSALFGFSSGVFMQQVTTEFGWSRAQFSSAFTVQMIAGLVIAPFFGRLVDRVGPRRVAITGIFMFIAGLSALGLANGSPVQWWLLGLVQAVCTALVSPPVWLSAVVPRFTRSRGLALAVGLAGIGVGAAFWPLVAAYFIETLGWRGAYPAMVLSWAIIVLPLALLFLKDPPRVAAIPKKPEASVETADYRRALISRSFVCIALAGGLFSTISFGTMVHLVPIMEAAGLGLTEAASLAGLMGLCTIAGRLGTGFLLDRLPTRPLGTAVFLLPIAVALLLWWGQGAWLPTVAAVVILGLAAGAELDILVFTVSRRFSTSIFASVYASVSAVLSIFASMGPLLGGRLFDIYGSYDIYLLLLVPMSLIATVLIWIALAPPPVSVSPQV